MATIEQRKNFFRLIFYFQNRRHTTSLATGDYREAEAIAGSVDRTLSLIRQGALVLPDGADLVAFVLSGGRQSQRPEPKRGAVETKSETPLLTLAEISQKYVAVQELGGMETASLYTVKIHLQHITATLGEFFPMQSLKQPDLQRHVQRRAVKPGQHGKPVQTATLKKELSSLRAMWNWAVASGFLDGPFPNKGLVFPKARQKPPFQTRAEIERRLQRVTTATEARELWDGLFLPADEVEELLDYVRDTASHPFIEPMFVFAAHTGARRSELMRVRAGDVDFESGFVLIREKKRDRGRETMRRVPMSERLVRCLTDWLVVHPGGPMLFARSERSVWSVKKHLSPVVITRDEATDHFRRTLAGGKWAVLRGWHVLRHSFISNCAAVGVDQRKIDSWSGHQTEDMRKRYTHLIPAQEREAMSLVFGRRVSTPENDS
ncbi:site-specific integrase [Zavarzinella formosa]|uniref:site-specific integrase n=1 Tax=Zavarzinella formosa TaxID=360055 RepID=UPI00030AFE3E|nr:site-specific integrase [Zavarzinella formosa]